MAEMKGKEHGDGKRPGAQNEYEERKMKMKEMGRARMKRGEKKTRTDREEKDEIVYG